MRQSGLQKPSLDGLLVIRKKTTEQTSARVAKAPPAKPAHDALVAKGVCPTKHVYKADVGYEERPVCPIKRMIPKLRAPMKTTAEIREEYIDKSNSVLSFVTNCLEVDPESFETKDNVYSAFVKYCKEKKFPGVSKGVFGTRLPQNAVVRTEKRRLFGKRIPCWQGIHLKEKQE